MDVPVRAVKGVTTLTAAVQVNSEQLPPMESQVQSITVNDMMADLVSQGEQVSYVFVSEGADALEWIHNSDIVLQSEDVAGNQETDQVIIVKTASDHEIHVATTDASQGDVVTGELPTQSHVLRSPNKKRGGSDHGQLSPKIIKLDEISHPYSLQMKPPDIDICQSMSVGDSCDFKSSLDAAGEDCNISSGVAIKSITTQESHNMMVTKGSGSKHCSPVITIYASSGGSTSSTGSSVKNLNQHPSVLPHQKLPTASESALTRARDAILLAHPNTMTDSDADYQIVEMSSSSTTVELPAYYDTSGGPQESKMAKESHENCGVNVNTGIVDGGVIYKCSECGYASSNKHYYKQHVDLVHNTARPFKCPFCDYAGKRGHALREHLIVHSAQRPFSCEHCNATFRKKGHLTNHTKLHATSAGSGGTLLASGQLPAEMGHIVKVTSAPGGSLGHLVKVPVKADVSNPIISVSAQPSGQLTVVPPKQSSQAGVTSLSKRGQLWCALCDKEMANARLFQSHLKTVHGTDRLFACYCCEYVTASMGAITKHLTLHNSTTTAPSNAAPPPAVVAVSCMSGSRSSAGTTTTTFNTTARTLSTAARVCNAGPVVGTNTANSALLSSTVTGVPRTIPMTLSSVSGAMATGSVVASSGAAPLYVCAHCSFSSPKMSMLVSHAASHNPGVGVGASGLVSVAGRTAAPPPVKQQTVMSKVICSECGHVADNEEMMRAHLWTHIDNTAAAEAKDRLPSAPQHVDQEKVVGVTVSASPGDLPNTTGPPALKTLPENAAFKCTECSYVSRDASQFVKHMLVHKTQQNQAPKAAQVESVSSSQDSSTGGSSNSKANAAYRVKPITTENTCRNTESSPFVHDASTGRFRCTICGYSCEYQRTIKAHIWKHSGHRQVDYPIFQNGPLSMYEYPVPTSQPAQLQGQGQGQSSTGVSSTRSETTHSLPPAHTSLETSSSTSCPVATHSGSKSACTSSSSPSSETAPVNIKFITVSGSQVLCSSKPLPPGSLKLVPMQPTAAVTKSSPVVMHVQGPQGGPVTQSSCSLLPSEKREGLSATAVVKTEPQGKEHSSVDKDQAALCKGSVSKAVGSMAFRSQVAEPVVSHSSPNQCDTISAVRDEALEVLKAGDVTAVKDGQGTTPTSATNVTVSVKTVASVASAKHILPVCAASDLHQKTVAVPLHPQSEIPLSKVHVQSEPKTDTTAGSAASIPKGDSEQEAEISSPGQGGAHVATGGVPDQTSATSTTPVPVSSSHIANEAERFLKIEGGKLVIVEAAPETSIASRVHSRHHCQPAVTSPSVIVQAVDTVSTHSSLTGMDAQQSSSQVPVNNTTCLEEESQTAVHSVLREEEMGASSMILDSRTQTQAEKKNTAEKSVSDLLETGFSVAESGVCSVNEKTDDSESAVTLLSLLKRGPNFNPACPPSPCKYRHLESLQEDLSQDFPDRSPTSSSDSDSLPRDSATDAASEDFASEMEPASSGKIRGGGGGICSSLLAVIEQLRERSRSESDVEDKQTPAISKKRTGRRRGRQESQEEPIETVDSENIEQFSREDGVTFRCKLCHYATAKMAHMRAHMRTHRPKEPFECSLCSMVAESSEALQEHMIQHCKIRTYTCKFCSHTFSHKSTLRAHMRAHNDSEPFMCTLCDFVCSSPLDYRAHMQKHAGNALLCCPRCPALVASRQDLMIHQADSCPATLPSPTSEGDKPDEASSEEGALQEKILCPKCGFTSTSQSCMDDHLAGHPGASLEVGEGPRSCTLCDFTALSSRSLKSHMKRHANDQRYVQQPLEQYKCSLCGYVCHHLPSLKSHMWRHASDQNYSYQFTNDIINAAIDFDTRTDPPAPQAAVAVAAPSPPEPEPELLDKVLSTERRIVEGEMNRAGDARSSQPICWVTFRCCQCGFETINKAKLNLHMRTHTDIINRTLKINPGSLAEGDSVPVATSSADSDNVNVRIVYGPV